MGEYSTENIAPKLKIIRPVGWVCGFVGLASWFSFAAMQTAWLLTRSHQPDATHVYPYSLKGTIFYVSGSELILSRILLVIFAAALGVAYFLDRWATKLDRNFKWRQSGSVFLLAIATASVIYLLATCGR
jgi:hypothetical protein